MNWRRLALGVALGAVVVAAVAFSLCRFLPIECHGSFEQDPFLGLAGSGEGTTKLPSGFTQEVVASGFVRPTSFAVLPGGNALVAEKRGVVWAVVDGRLRRPPLLDIRDRVADYGYRGLLAFEPEPPFSETSALYVMYVQGRGRTQTPTSVRISRFELDGRRSREQVVLGRGGTRSCTELPPGADCIPCDRDHCGGDLDVAPDGSLWVSTGDGWDGSAGFSQDPLGAQDLQSLGGKVLHVSAAGRGLRENPFWDAEPAGNRSRVWAYGLRNPFRFTLSPRGEPVVGDVGWDEWEEVDVVRRADNLGWPCFEGPERPHEYATQEVCRDLYSRGPPAVRLPTIAYRRGSVTGGVFYEASSFPPRFRGGYFYGDWSRSVLRFARFGPDGRARQDAEDFATTAAGPVDLEVGPDGNLYYLALNAGELRRISYDG